MGWVVNATPLQLYPLRKVPGTHCIGGWVGPSAGLDGCGKSAPRLDPQTVLPVESMYRLSYRGHRAVLKVPFNKPAVSAVSRCRLHRTMNAVIYHVPPRCTDKTFPSSKRPGRLWGPRSLIQWGCFRGGWVAGHEVNLLTPNDPYRGRTAPLTSKRCILYIYSTNIGTECFKHGIYYPYFSLQNAACFIILTYLVPVLFTCYIQLC